MSLSKHIRLINKQPATSVVYVNFISDSLFNPRDIDNKAVCDLDRCGNLGLHVPTWLLYLYYYGKAQNLILKIFCPLVLVTNVTCASQRKPTALSCICWVFNVSFFWLCFFRKYCAVFYYTFSTYNFNS